MKRHHFFPQDQVTRGEPDPFLPYYFQILSRRNCQAVRARLQWFHSGTKKQTPWSWRQGQHWSVPREQFGTLQLRTSKAYKDTPCKIASVREMIIILQILSWQPNGIFKKVIKSCIELQYLLSYSPSFAVNARPFNKCITADSATSLTCTSKMFGATHASWARQS